MPKSVVIVGGGFAGVECARRLRGRLPAEWDVVVFSRENHFIFTPLLAEVVGSSINPLHVVRPIRQMLPHAVCLTAETVGVDFDKHLLRWRMADGREATRPYDHLVLACGAAVNLDIVPGMAAHGMALKTLGDALALRNRIIERLEQAEIEPDPETRRRLLGFVVVGGGFSGVEVAGEMHDLIHEAKRYYAGLRKSDARVVLLQSRERLLPEMPVSLAHFARDRMVARGIDVRLCAKAAAVTENGVRLADGAEIGAATVVCTIGTTVHPFIAALKLPSERGRIKTDPDMRVCGKADVWAIGDCAAVINAADGAVSAPIAQVATRQGRQLADNIAAAIHGRPVRPFSYKLQGMLAAIGRRNAVGEVFGWKFSGFAAWFVWRGIYLFKMPTLARKIQIAFDWAWDLLFPRDIVQLSTALTERLSRAHFETGEFVFRTGDPAECFYLIDRGKAGVYPNESAAPAAVLGPGAYFGERALLSGTAHTASVKAEEPLDVVTLGRGSFSDLLNRLTVLRSSMEASVRQIKASDEFIRIARDHPELEKLTAGDVMKSPTATLPVSLNLGEALEHCRHGGKGAYPVVDAAGRMVGICTRTDFYRAVRDLRHASTPISAVMCSPVITVTADTPAREVVLKFLRETIKRVVVVKADDPAMPAGMLTPFDILSAIRDSDFLPPGRTQEIAAINLPKAVGK